MKRYKIVIVFVFCFIIAIYGVFMVNVAYTKSNEKTIDKSIFALMNINDEIPKLSYDALYGEINISKGEEKKLAIYLNTKPFDIRFGLENKVFYINSSILNNFKKSYNNIIN